MDMEKQKFLDALALAAYHVSVDKLFLTDSYDTPIYPESLVQVFSAQSLSRKVRSSRIELEYPTVSLEKELCGNIQECNVCERSGRVDIVIWSSSSPFAVVEVKDQLIGTDDGLVKDAVRIQELLSIEHRLFKKPLLSFGGLIAYVGKSSKQYKEYKPFDQDLDGYSERTIKTVKNNITNAINSKIYEVDFLDGRCIDSSRDKNKLDPYLGTEDEDLLSGEEQMTKYIVAVISKIVAPNNAFKLTP